MTTAQLNAQELRVLAFNSAWKIAKDAVFTHKVGKAKDYFSGALKLAYSRLKSGSKLALSAVEINLKAEKLYSDNSHIYKGASINLKENSLTIASEGFMRASMFFGQRIKWLKTWVEQTNRFSWEKIAEFKAELDYLNNTPNKQIELPISPKQYAWLEKLFYNDIMAKYSSPEQEITYFIQEKNGQHYVIKETK